MPKQEQFKPEIGNLLEEKEQETGKNLQQEKEKQDLLNILVSQKGDRPILIAFKEKTSLSPEQMGEISMKAIEKIDLKFLILHEDWLNILFEECYLPENIFVETLAKVMIGSIPRSGDPLEYCRRIPNMPYSAEVLQKLANAVVLEFFVHYHSSSVADEFLEYEEYAKMMSRKMLPSQVVEKMSECLAPKNSEYRNVVMAQKLKDKFEIKKEDMLSEKFRQALKEAVVNSFSNWSNPEQGKKLMEEFYFTKEDFDEIAPYIISNLLIEKYLDEASQFINDFNIPKTVIEDTVRQHGVVRYHLVQGDSDFIFQIVERLQISGEVLSEADELLADTWDDDDDYLIRQIKLLSDKKCFEFFPKSMEKIKERLLTRLPEDVDLADYFLENLGNYDSEPWVGECLNKAVIHYSVAQKLLDDTSWFTNIPNELKEQLWFSNAMDEAKLVAEAFEKDNENDEGGNMDFSEYDPYENDPNFFTPEQAHLATVLAEVMQGKVDINKLQELGLNEDAIEALNKINETIDRLYKDLFLSGLKFYPEITEEEKLAFTEPAKSPIKMTPLINNIRAFVARYITQTVEGNIQHLNSEIKKLELTIDQIIGEGLNRYLKIHEVDIPLYDKLYEEFDAWREAGRYPLEVYLGRDGIYAYIGRRAQDTARRRKLGSKKRRILHEAGEVLEITPKYLVYPRYFRDNLNYETKREFLEQERISKDADPLFYDTGYTGTIPEQIMEIMDFEPEEIEQRIRLLSAQSAQRRVKGIPENARSEIVEYIEHNSKTEQSAEGLIIDKKTGKIRHIAKPTTPEEQFYFMMIKQAISRHYWFKEMMYHEPTGNINLDSEYYTLRIRKEYLDQLPEEFIKNTKEYLNKHGEILKSSKGVGEYPDEEIILFKLKDSTEIVAKKIELRKTKEARKEFAILISAKKHNLKTAEPVGFLTGKTEKDGSYLLMGKIEGISGRKFEKQLRESGKYTEDQIKSIMQTVVEKNKEMAEMFKEKLNIDKRWRVKDTIIQFNEQTGEVEEVIPIDWERVQTYDPDNPKEIDEVE